MALIAASLLSFLAMLTFSGAFLVLHIAIDLALVAYVAAVLTITRRTQARGSVTYLARHQVGGIMPVAAEHPRQTVSR